MASETIRTALEQATTYLRAHPAEARYTDTAASATLVDGLAIRVRGPAGEEITTDMSPSVGGSGTGPSPGWLLRAAAASCVATLTAMRAAMVSVELDELEVIVDSESDDRGILGIDESVPAGPLSGRIEVRIRALGDVQSGQLEKIARWGVEHCPVRDALERAVPIKVEVITG